LSGRDPDDVRGLLMWVAHETGMGAMVVVDEDPASELARLCLYRLNASQAERVLFHCQRRVRAGKPLTPRLPRAVVVLKRRIEERQRRQDLRGCVPRLMGD
jgi:hypothetical protein